MHVHEDVHSNSHAGRAACESKGRFPSESGSRCHARVSVGKPRTPFLAEAQWPRFGAGESAVTRGMRTQPLLAQGVPHGSLDRWGPASRHETLATGAARSDERTVDRLSRSV